MFDHDFLTKDFLIDYGCSAQLLMSSMTFIAAPMIIFGVN